MSGLTFDAGALVGFDRAQRRAVRLVARAWERGERLAVPRAWWARCGETGASK